MSNVVKLTPTAMGPLSQFMLSPLYSPRITPSCETIARMVPRIVTYDDPVTPAVCIRRRTTSRGYEADCPIRPAQAPKAKRSWGYGWDLLVFSRTRTRNKERKCSASELHIVFSQQNIQDVTSMDKHL